MTLGDVIRSGLSAFRGRPGGRPWLLRLLELGFGLSALFRMLGQGGPPFSENYYGLRRGEVGRPGAGAILSRPRRRTSLPPTRVPRFQKPARLPPECLRHGCCRRAPQRGSPAQRLDAKKPRSWICSGCFRMNLRTSAGVTPSMSTGAGEVGRPSPDGLYRGVGPNHRLVSHGAVTADHR